MQEAESTYDYDEDSDSGSPPISSIAVTTTNKAVASADLDPSLTLLPASSATASLAAVTQSHSTTLFDIQSGLTLQVASPTTMAVSSSTTSPLGVDLDHVVKLELEEGDSDMEIVQPLAVISSTQHHPTLIVKSPHQILPQSTTSMPQSSTESVHDLPSVSNPAANVAAADSNSPKQTFVPCRVCGDKASGYHYGVTSCEGCKGFFRRSIQKQIEYRCLRDGKCLVMRLNRNRCQYCRFKKCLAVGMSRDSVRYGRMPRRSKSTEEQRVSTSESGGEAQDQATMESRQLAIYDIILTISQAHHANCMVTEDKVKNMVKKPASLLVKLESSVEIITADILDTHRCQMFQNIAAMVTPSINNVVEFAKRVPGFNELTQDDQLVLIKGSFFEIWLTRMSKMFNEGQKVVVFGDGSIIPQDELEIIFSPDLVHHMYTFAQSFSQLQLNDTEVGLFTGVILASPDRPSLCNTRVVERIQDKLIEALKLQISRNHSTEPNLFPSILMKIPELRSVGAKHQEQVSWFRQRWAKMRLPPLFSEIFDIPKMEEDAQQLQQQEQQQQEQQQVASSGESGHATSYWS